MVVVSYASSGNLNGDPVQMRSSNPSSAALFLGLKKYYCHDHYHVKFLSQRFQKYPDDVLECASCPIMSFSTIYNLVICSMVGYIKYNYRYKVKLSMRVLKIKHETQIRLIVIYYKDRTVYYDGKLRTEVTLRSSSQRDGIISDGTASQY